MRNTTEVLIRNLEALPRPALVLGMEDAGAAQHLPPSLSLMTTHYGVYRQMAQVRGPAALFGYRGWPEEPLAAVVVLMPKSRPELDYRLQLAAELVQPGGEVWLLGAKKEGIGRGVGQLRALDANAAKRDNARHCQLWVARPPVGAGFPGTERFFTERPLALAGISLTLVDFPGVFSEGRLDEGTRLLLETLDEKPAGPVLDFACGGGVIGLWLKKRWPDLELTLADVQAQALECSRRALARNGVVAELLPTDGLAHLEGRFGTIITNPPFHQGVKTDRSMTEAFIAGAAGHLEPGGELRLVANRFLPYAAHLAEHFRVVDRVKENRRFCVYRAR